MNNFHKRNKSKWDNRSEGGEGISLMEIEQESLDNDLFWRDNKSWYQEPASLHYSPEISRNHSQFEIEDQQHQVASDKKAYGSSQVRSQIHMSQIRLFEGLSNKSQCLTFKLSQKQKNQVGCKCTKVNCLKRTCGCFDNGKYCGINCICQGCKNIQENKSDIQKAKVEAKLRSNRSIFDNIQHHMPEKVCTCPKSRCQKKYCQCYQAGIPCNEFCKCLNCLNTQSNIKQLKYENGSNVQKSSYSKSMRRDSAI